MSQKLKASEIDRIVGSNLKKFRIANGLSQTVLAEYVDVSFQQIQKYERGIDRISAGKLQLLAWRLGLNIAEFFDETEIIIPSEGKSCRVTLLKNFSKMKDINQREAVCRLVRTLVNE